MAPRVSAEPRAPPAHAASRVRGPNLTLTITLTLALTLNLTLTLALAPQVLGDYGAGPNHVLPTAGTGKYTGGLSVHTFLRQRTWMRIDDVKVRGREGGGGG